MRDCDKITEIDFTEGLKMAHADEKAGYPPKCNKGYIEENGKCVKEKSEASKECNNEDCGNCDCDTEPKESQAEQEMVEVEEYDMSCPSCGCSLGRSWMKAGVMSRPMYASKYSDLYKKVKAADPQHDVDKQPEIKTKFESQRKIEDMPNAVELRDVDEPLEK
jgi:hypothetical protein